jgi:hypothetical protein
MRIHYELTRDFINFRQKNVQFDVGRYLIEKPRCEIDSGCMAMHG